MFVGPYVGQLHCGPSSTSNNLISFNFLARQGDFWYVYRSLCGETATGTGKAFLIILYLIVS